MPSVVAVPPHHSAAKPAGADPATARNGAASELLHGGSGEGIRHRAGVCRRASEDGEVTNVAGLTPGPDERVCAIECTICQRWHKTVLKVADIAGQTDGVEGRPGRGSLPLHAAAAKSMIDKNIWRCPELPGAPG